MSDQEIRFRVVLDDAGVPASAGRTVAGLQQVGNAALRSSTALGISAGQTANAFRQLPAQFTDIVTSLQGGQNPFTVLLQQGGQIKDSFGGIGPAARALVGFLTPARLAFGGLAAAAGVFALAAYQGHQESAQLTKTLALTGDAAGKTRGQIEAMAGSLSAQGNAPIGQAREALQALAATGAFVGSNMEGAGRAVLALQRLSGQSAADIVKDFAGMRGGVAAWAAEHNRSYNYLTAAQYSYIRSLEAQGRTQDAISANLQVLAQTMENRAVPALGALELAIEGVKSAGSGFWDWLKGVGRAETAEDKLASVTKRLESARTGIYSRGDIPELRQQQAYAQEEIRMARRATEDKAQAAQAEQSGILEASRSFVDAQLGIQSAGQALALAEQLRGSQARRLQADADYRQRNISAQQYTDAIISAERGRMAAEVKSAQAAIDIERRRVTEKPEDELNKKRSIVAAETALVGVLAKRDQLQARIRANEFRVTPDAGVESAQSQFRSAELRGYEETQRLLAGQRLQSAEAARQLVESNRSLSNELILDDRARGLALIAAEEEQLRKRLDINALSVEDRKRVEDDFAQWRVLREQQLTEQLKPQWRRDAELWADTTRDMKRRFDEFQQGFVDSGRSAFAQWAQDGRITTSGLASYIRGEFAKLAYERYLSGYVRQAGTALFNALLGSGGSGGSGYPDDLPTRGGKAGGGSVPGASAWVVGERGPEVLVMGRNPGYVLPNNALGGGGGQAVQVVQNFNVRGNEDLSTMYALAAMARDQAIAGVAEARRRGSPAFS